MRFIPNVRHVFNDSSSIQDNSVPVGCHGNAPPRSPPPLLCEHQRRRNTPITRTVEQHVTSLSHNAPRRCHGRSLSERSSHGRKNSLTSVVLSRFKLFVAENLVRKGSRNGRRRHRCRCSRRSRSCGDSSHPMKRRRGSRTLPGPEVGYLADSLLRGSGSPPTPQEAICPRGPGQYRRAG